MFQYTMWMLVHLTHLVLSSASPSYEIFCCSFLIKILHNSEMNFKTYPYLLVGVCCIETPTNHLHTTFGRIKQYSLYLLLSFLHIKIRNIHTIPHYTVRLQPKTHVHVPPGILEQHRIDSLSSLGHITCEWKASSSQPTITLDVISVYPCFQKYLIKSNQGP